MMANLSISALSLLRAPVSRRMCTVLASIFVMALAMAAPVTSADQVCPPTPKPGCFTQPNLDVAFLIDRSGSIAYRGQTYNIEIEGVAGALRDATVIPRDGSVAVVVVLFSETATVAVPLTQIDSEAKATEVADKVAALKCNDSSCQLMTRSQNPGTNYTRAIQAADIAISQVRSKNPKPGARRVFLMLSDGEPDDPDLGAGAVKKARQAAASQSTPFELDVILMGLACDSQELKDSQERMKKIITPLSAKDLADEPDLPGATFFIGAGPANQVGVVSAGGADFSRQVSEIVALTRRILGSNGQTISLIVTTSADSVPDTPPANNVLSLRQAIEFANCNGGNATITFAGDVKNKTISPLTPLPALTAPDITIDGLDQCGMKCDQCGMKCDQCGLKCDQGDMECDQCDEMNCVPSVTIDGSHTDVTAGEAHRDGILIRSNHDVVRGLKIINFKRSGIAVAPLCPSDHVGGNQIKRNVLMDNTIAGVLILDLESSQGKLVTHNVGNTISRNVISGSATPIDLGGDGQTPNDPGDADEGPNTLLNFPTIDSITPTGLTVTLKGQAAAGQVIEIFGITKIGNESAGRVIEGMEFIRTITADLIDGTFTATDLPASPTGRYTATATDPFVSDSQCRNTSEFTPICTAPAQAKITLQDDQSVLEFVSALARSTSKKKKAPVETLTRTFTMTNAGCDTVKVSGVSVQRTGGDVKSAANLNGAIIDPDDSRFFSVTNPDGSNLVFPITISPGDQHTRTFFVHFHPAIPRVADSTSGLAASDVLPADFTSVLKIEHDGEGDHEVRLRASVGTAVQLINSEGGKSEPLTFTRSGDEFTVTFSVYDSDLTVDKAEYKFFDATGTRVPVEAIDGNLGSAIKNHTPRLITGQSFTVIQKLPSLKNHPNIVEVNVTVSDEDTSADASVKLVTTSSQAVSAQSLRETPGAVLILPPAKLRAIAKKNLFKQKATRLKQRPADLKYLRISGVPKPRARREQR